MSTAANDARLPGRDRSESTLRFITAASLFDGHDAAINIVRRLLQSNGAEVVHLGHNRSVADIVRAALQEDADAIACSSYQGGHNEYFRYMVDMLRDAGAEHVRIVVGGGGTIAPDEIESLEAYGVEKIYDADEGLALGLQGMAEDIFRRVRSWPRPEFDAGPADPEDHRRIGQILSLLEEAVDSPERIEALRRRWSETDRLVPVIGMTGTGGAGKSSLVDELLNRFLRCFPARRVAVLAVDPTRRRSGGALLQSPIPCAKRPTMWSKGMSVPAQ